MGRQYLELFTKTLIEKEFAAESPKSWQHLTCVYATACLQVCSISKTLIQHTRAPTSFKLADAYLARRRLGGARTCESELALPLLPAHTHTTVPSPFELSEVATIDYCSRLAGGASVLAWRSAPAPRNGRRGEGRI
jgi:hypothetical protein